MMRRIFLLDSGTRILLFLFFFVGVYKWREPKQIYRGHNGVLTFVLCGATYPEKTKDGLHRETFILNSTQLKTLIMTP